MPPQPHNYLLLTTLITALTLCCACRETFPGPPLDSKPDMDVNLDANHNTNQKTNNSNNSTNSTNTNTTNNTTPRDPCQNLDATDCQKEPDCLALRAGRYMPEMLCTEVKNSEHVGCITRPQLSCGSTPAVAADPAEGACFRFTDNCIPNGWVRDPESCPTLIVRFGPACGEESTDCQILNPTECQNADFCGLVLRDYYDAPNNCRKQDSVCIYQGYATGCSDALTPYVDPITNTCYFITNPCATNNNWLPASQGQCIAAEDFQKLNPCAN